MIVSANSAAHTLFAALSLQQASYKPAPNVGPFHATSTDIQEMGDRGNVNTTAYISMVASEESRPLKSREAGCAVQAQDSPDLSLPSFAPYDRKTADIFRYRKQLSVNLGSWFVQENWMNPSLFSCAAGPKAAELDVANGWENPKSARAVLEKHWDTWITEDDFAWLQRIGINTVRIPIGYWSLGASYCQGTPFEQVSSVYERSWPRVLRAISWASKHNIGVLIDLHGAPGSQNGNDGQANLFHNDNNVQKTIDVLTYLTRQLTPISNIVGIQILNEPNDVASLPSFYARVINTLRKVSPEASRFPFYIHDGFNLQRFADFVGGRKDFVVQDHHSYFVFTPSDSAKPAGEHTSGVNSVVLSALTNASKKARHNLVVDEWSCALTPQSLSYLPNEAKQLAARKSFCSGQSLVYLRSTAGWSFWSYKTENCDTEDGWCFRQAVGRSLPSKFSVWDGAEDSKLGVLQTREGKDDKLNLEARHARPTDQGMIPAHVGNLNSGAHQINWTPSPAEGTLETSSDPGSLTTLPTRFGPNGGRNSLDNDSEQPLEIGDSPESASPTVTPISVHPSDPEALPPKGTNNSPTRIALDVRPKFDYLPAAGPAGLLVDDGTSAPASAIPRSTKDGISDGMIPHGPSPLNADDMTAASVISDEGPVYYTISMDSDEDSNHSAPARRANGPNRGVGSGSTVARLAAHQKSAAKKHGAASSSSSSGDKGYQDGYAAALTFGRFDGSRLGFATQYMEDSLSALIESKLVQPGKEDAYRKGFVRGVEVGEVKVAEAIAKGVPVPTA